MIYAEIGNLHRYLGMNKNLDAAIRFLTEQGVDGLHEGRNEVAGEDVYVNMFEYDTIPEADGIWEAHLQYADIHVDVSGTEKIGVANIQGLKQTVVKKAEDFVGYEGSAECWAPLSPGKVLIVFPEDAHMVKIQNGGAAHVRKAVFKVKV